MVTPTFNRCDELEHLIHSINNQTLESKYFELIICDDGSTDGTEKTIKNANKIKAMGPQMVPMKTTAISTSTNMGIIAPYNAGNTESRFRKTLDMSWANSPVGVLSMALCGSSKILRTQEKRRLMNQAEASVGN